MTTDTFPKQFSVEYKGIQVGGICKGAGMIAPNMATMLCFITTNAKIGKRGLQSALARSVEDSFNMLSVDGDQSTNDMVLLLSSGKKDCSLKDFQTALDAVTKNLAKMIAKDGEGATKFIEVEVRGTKNKATARKVVHAILDSPLIKTALYGENPNWGRIMAKLGSVVELDESKVDIFFESGKGKVKVAGGGVSAGKNNYAEDILKAKEVRIMVDLRSGRAYAVGWGCDLTPEYVKINAGYS
jgi:glutamate N-acetyltransferase/amino-acid N-acetyltransferase